MSQNSLAEKSMISSSPKWHR